MADIGIGSVALSDHDSDWFRVMCSVSNTSLRGKTAAVLSYYVRRRKEEYKEIVKYTANKYGLSYSECFNKLRRGDNLGDPLDYFEPDVEMERKIQGDIEPLPHVAARPGQYET